MSIKEEIVGTHHNLDAIIKATLANYNLQMVGDPQQSYVSNPYATQVPQQSYVVSDPQVSSNLNHSYGVQTLPPHQSYGQCINPNDTIQQNQFTVQDTTNGKIFKKYIGVDTSAEQLERAGHQGGPKYRCKECEKRLSQYCLVW